MSSPERWLIDFFSGRSSASGINVNETTALQSTAVYACVRILAETIASLPFPVYERLSGGGKARAPNHPLYSVLQEAANSEMTSFTLRETLMGHILLWGNAYAEIEYNNAGQVIGLWPLRPDRTWPERNAETKQIQYRTALTDGTQAVLPFDKVLHIAGLGYDGLIGYSPIHLAREAVGLAIATEKFGATFFGNGTNVGGVAKHPGKLSEQGSKNLRQSINETYAGLGNSHRVMLLEEGMTFEKVGIPPEDAQFLQTRQFQLNEISRIFRVPPHMIGDLSRATFSNVEQQSIDFVVHTIRPWLVRLEQAVKFKLFTPSERRRFFAEFLVDGLLRGDIKSRYEAYSIGRQNGWLSADDVRELENMNPLPDGTGKVYLVPLNMVPADKVYEQFKQTDLGGGDNNGQD